MSTTDYTTGQVYDLDPAVLTIGTNVRTDVRERDEFAKSIKAVGVLEPITAYVGQDGALVVYRGQRRTLTAAQVGTPTGTVPVRVVDSPEDAERIVAQVSENVHRAAMHASEERDAIEQLALLGVSAHQISKRTAFKREHVDAALAVAKSTEAKTRMDEAGLTLIQASALAEFEDDPHAMEQLERELGWGRSIEHTVQRLRDDRAEAAELRTEAERLRGEGVPALDPEERPTNLWPLRLSTLVRVSDGEQVPEEEWPTVPGAAVVLDKGYEWVPDEAPGVPEEPGEAATEDEAAEDDAEVEESDWEEDQGDEDDEDDEHGHSVEVIEHTWVCLDPEAAGLCSRYEYTDSRRQSGASTEQEDLDHAEVEAAAEAAAEAKRTERRRVIDNNKSWRSAEKVRREWLAEFVSRKSAPKGAEALICAAVIDGPHWLRQAFEGSHRLLRQLLTGEPADGWSPQARKQIEELASSPTTPKAQSMRTVAAIITAWEASTDVHTWRSPGPWDRRVMEALTAWGYKASEVELLLLNQEDEPAEDDEGQDDEDTEGQPAA